MDIYIRGNIKIKYMVSVYNIELNIRTLYFPKKKCIFKLEMRKRATLN